MTVDWDMFRMSSDNINEFTDVVISFISQLTDEIIPKVIVKVYPNQKPWVDRSIREALNAQTSAYNNGLSSGDMTSYKVASYQVRKAVKAAKKRYREKVETHLGNRDSRSVWQGLKMMSDYRGRSATSEVVDPSLVNDLNSLYTRFEVSDEYFHNNAVSPAASFNNGATCDLPEDQSLSMTSEEPLDLSLAASPLCSS